MSDAVVLLPDRWRSEAAMLRAYGASEAATAAERCAAELDAALAAQATEALTLAEAAGESGYSTVQLGRLVREGKVPNVGRKGSPRVRRADLPRKPGRGPRPRAAASGGKDLADEVLARREAP